MPALTPVVGTDLSQERTYGQNRLLALDRHRQKHNNAPKDPREELGRYENEFVFNEDGQDILAWWKVFQYL